MTRTISIILCLSGALGCAYRPGGRDSELRAGEVPMWTAALAPTDGGTVRGKAIAIVTGERRGTRLVVTIEGSRNGALHPWDIHEGRCGGNGAIVGRASDYPPVPIGGAGAASVHHAVVHAAGLAVGHGGEHFPVVAANDFLARDGADAQALGVHALHDPFAVEQGEALGDIVEDVAAAVALFAQQRLGARGLGRGRARSRERAPAGGASRTPRGARGLAGADR